MTDESKCNNCQLTASDEDLSPTVGMRVVNPLVNRGVRCIHHCNKADETAEDIKSGSGSPIRDGLKMDQWL